jgi:hypothetical protein
MSTATSKGHKTLAISVSPRLYEDLESRAREAQVSVSEYLTVGVTPGIDDAIQRRADDANVTVDVFVRQTVEDAAISTAPAASADGTGPPGVPGPGG